MAKYTVLQWEKIQMATEDTPEGNALYDHIEQRTFGKRYSQECAIKLSAKEQRTVDALVEKLTAENRFDPRYRD